MPTFHEALLEALDQVTPELPALLDGLSDTVTATTVLDDQATEQLLRAFVALLREGIEGGREQRDLVMSTAVPALVSAGESPADLVQSSVAFFMGLQARIVAVVAAEHREAAALWLARFAAGYVREVLEVAEGAR